MAPTQTTPSFVELLESVVTEPGRLEAAFTHFHNYSLGNMLLAFGQCLARGIAMGPLATYRSWQGIGRQVRKGEKALMLCQPQTITRTETDANGQDTEVAFTRFVYRNHWFVLSQTDGVAYVPPAPPTWNKAQALAALQVEEVSFELLDGNTLGYATRRQVAVSPVAPRPFPVLVHELAHVVLGHTGSGDMLQDGAQLRRDVREVEAESVALLVLGTLGESGLEFCRGYVQHWLKGQAIDERTAQRIFKAADTILRAGRVEPAAEPIAA